MSSKPKILVVDDEERFRTTLCRLLKVNEMTAESVGSAREAFEELEKNPYDVVLLDVKMPEMNGIDALAEIKKMHPGVEVIILTGHASVDVAVQIMRLGGYEYLLKPCSIEELLLKVDSAFERKKAREERQKKAGITPTTLAS